jgi:KaiC/GvpD/RAD55 family RecA-like ATPase
MERIKTGIPGLDDMLYGGIPSGSSVLVTGSCGTGKSILSLQYAVKGALDGNPGLYVAFEETREKIIEHGLQFGWDIGKLMEKGLLNIHEVETQDIQETLEIITEKARQMNAQRLVLDSLTTMMEHGIVYRSQASRQMGKALAGAQKMSFPSETHNVTRKDVYNIVRHINRMGVTSLLISEVAQNSQYLSRDTISEFAVDGVIFLEINSYGGKPERLLSIKKMRNTPVNLSMAIMEFMEKGIVLKT